MTRVGQTACLLNAMWALSAWAGPPFVTNDPDPPALGQWEVNLPWTLKRAKDGSLSGELLTFDVNYGYDPYTQLSIELPVPYSRPEGDAFHTGVGDVLLEYKRRFGANARAGYFGINPQLTSPTGDDARGLGAGRVTLQLPVLYQRQWGDTVFYADLRYKAWAGEQGKSFWFFGGAFEHPLGARLKLGVEVFGTTPQAPDGTDNAGFNVGFKYALVPGLVLMGSGGRSFRSEPELTLLLGFKVLMPP
jgi:hypothetical protein